MPVCRYPPRHPFWNKTPKVGLGFDTLGRTGRNALNWAPAREAEGRTMRKPILGILLLLGAGCGVVGQEATNVAVPFRESSAAHVNLLSGSTSDNAPLLTSEASTSDSFVLATPAAPPAEPAPAPTPVPKYVFGNRDDYRWQLGLGLEFFRFRSDLINASMVGVNTTLTYFTNDWFALEGSFLTAFAPTVYDREHVKYFSGAGGIRVGSFQAVLPHRGRLGIHQVLWPEPE